MPEDLFISLLFLKDIFAGYEIPGLWVIFLQNFEDIIPLSCGSHHFYWEVSVWSYCCRPEGNVFLFIPPASFCLFVLDLIQFYFDVYRCIFIGIHLAQINPSLSPSLLFHFSLENWTRGRIKEVNDNLVFWIIWTNIYEHLSGKTDLSPDLLMSFNPTYCHYLLCYSSGF